MNRDPLDSLATRPSLLLSVRNADDSDSWQEFYQLYSRLVRSFAYRNGLTETEVEDVVQETFIAVSKAMPEFRYNPSIGSFRSWMLHTTHWRIQDQFQKRRKQQKLRSTTAEDSTRPTNVEQLTDSSFEELQAVWDREWEQNLLSAVLQRIKPQISARQFQIFDLSVLKEWPVRKIARALSVNVSQVYLTKHRVAKLIKKEVKQLQAQYS